MRLPGQFLGQRARALDRPSQRRLGIAPRCRFHQAVQRRQQLRVVQDRAAASSARPADALGRQRGLSASRGLQLRDSSANGGWRHVRCFCHSRHASPTHFQGLARRPQPPRPLVERPLKLSKLPPNPGDGLCVLHPQVIAQSPCWHNTKFTKLFFYKPLVYGPAWHAGHGAIGGNRCRRGVCPCCRFPTRRPVSIRVARGASTYRRTTKTLSVSCSMTLLASSGSSRTARRVASTASTLTAFGPNVPWRPIRRINFRPLDKGWVLQSASVIARSKPGLPGCGDSWTAMLLDTMPANVETWKLPSGTPKSVRQ